MSSPFNEDEDPLTPRVPDSDLDIKTPFTNTLGSPYSFAALGKSHELQSSFESPAPRKEEAADQSVSSSPLRLLGDVHILTGPKRPLSGDLGTGAGFAGRGSLYTSSEEGMLFINGGTKVKPAWHIV